MTTLTIGGLAAARLRAGWPTYVPTAVGLAVAVALATAVTVTSNLTDQASLRAALDRLGPSALVEVHRVQLYDAVTYASFRQGVGAAAREDMQGLLAPRAYNLVASAYHPDSFNGAKVDGDRARHNLSLASYDGLQQHVDLVAGAWPATAKTADGANLVTLPQAAAATLRLQPGDRECVLVVDRTDKGFCAQVAGIWVPRDLTEAYWGSDRLVPAGFFVGPDAYFQAVNARQGLSISSATAVLAPDLAAIERTPADQVLDRFTRLRGLFGIADADATVSTSLDAALQDYVQRRRVAAFALRLVGAQLLLVALYFVAFLSGHLLEQNFQAIAVWRTRGWSWRGIASLLLLELLALTVPAVPAGAAAGVLAALGAARLAYAGTGTAPGQVDLLSLAVPLAAVVATGLLVMSVQVVLASWRGVRRVRAHASRPQVAWWRRRYLDLALALLSLPLLAQVRLLGGSDVRQAGAAEDPLNLLLPGLALAFLALAALRLLPPYAALLVRLGHGVAQRLAAVQLRRAPAQHTRLALLLTMTVALGIFAATYATTSSRSAADRADYQAGADLRAVFGGAIPPDLTRLRVDGAAAATPVFRGYARPGGSRDDIPILGVDPYSFPRVGWNRPGLTPAGYASLLAPLATQEQGGLLLPDGASSLSIWVDGAGTGAHFSARLSDGLGRPIHADFGILDFRGWRQLTAALAPEAPPARIPVRFRELVIDAPRAPGRIGLSDLRAGTALLAGFDRVPSATDSPFGPNSSPGEFWWATDQDTGTNRGGLDPTDADVRRNGTPVDSIWMYETGGLPVYVRPDAGFVLVRAGGASFGHVVREPVPALLPAAALAVLGLKLGEIVNLQVDNVMVSSRLVGTTDLFPTVYPTNGQFFVLQEDMLLAALGEANHQRPWASELWVSVPGQAGPTADALRRLPGVVQVVERAQLESEAGHAPQQLGLLSSLSLGFGAALALALLGFGLHFLLVARARLSDYAILEANGMSPEEVRTSLALEQAVLLGFSLAAGAGLGALLALGLLPALQLSSAESDLVPPTLVAADPRLVLGALGLVGLGGLLAGRAIGSAASHPPLMSELRSLG